MTLMTSLMCQVIKPYTVL